MTVLRHFAALLLAAGTASTGGFPIGLYGVPPEAPFEELTEAGFTALLPAATEPEAQFAMAQAARRAGLDMYGIPSPEVMALRPAASWSVAGWYLADEPEVYRVPPGEIGRQAAALRAWDPRKPLVLVVGEGRAAADYAPHVDQVWVDWYPVPHLLLASTGWEISAAKAASSGKPVLAVIQTMDWKDYPQRDPRKPRIGRFPSAHELRFMAYHAVIRGASGLYFFEFRKRNHPPKTLLDYPEQWQALRRVVREVKMLAPILAESEGEALAVAPLEGRRWRYPKGELVVIANPSDKEAPLPSDFLAGRYRTVFEDRLAVREAIPSGMLRPGRVLVAAPY